MTVGTQVYYTEKMPKTATGKVQRRRVAQSMIGRETPAAEEGSQPPKLQFLAVASEVEVAEKEKLDGISKHLQGSLLQRIARLLGTGPKMA